PAAVPPLLARPMKRIETSLAVALGALALFVGSQSYRAATTGHTEQLTSSGTVAALTPTSPTVHRTGAAAVAELPIEVRRMSPDEVRERLLQNEAGTYIGEVL